MTGPEHTETRVRDELREFIEQNFLYMRPDYRLDDHDDLLKIGVIDSIGFIELVDEVQTRYGIEVQDVEITEENFGSVTAMVRFITRKATP
jgi:acyl carrier protein